MLNCIANAVFNKQVHNMRASLTDIIAQQPDKICFLHVEWAKTKNYNGTIQLQVTAKDAPKAEFPAHLRDKIDFSFIPYCSESYPAVHRMWVQLQQMSQDVLRQGEWAEFVAQHSSKSSVSSFNKPQLATVKNEQ